MPTITPAISTTAVPLTTAFWLGHSTFFSSAQASPTKCTGPEPGTWGSSARGWLGARSQPHGRLAPCESGLLLCAPVPALLTRLPRHARWGLPGLPVRGVLLAPAAVLLELDPVG